MDLEVCTFRLYVIRLYVNVVIHLYARDTSVCGCYVQGGGVGKGLAAHAVAAAVVDQPSPLDGVGIGLEAAGLSAVQPPIQTEGWSTAAACVMPARGSCVGERKLCL